MIGEKSEIIQPCKDDQKQVKKRTNYIPGENIGKWAELQQLRYIVFLDFNKNLMRSKEKRSSNRFYEHMAQFITTRNALQCRSHHQKLQEKYGHYTKIIKRYKKTFNKSLYRQNISNLEMNSTNYIDQQSKSRQIFKIQQKEYHNISVQTQLCGIQKKYVIMPPGQLKIQEQEYQPIVYAPNKNYLGPNNRILHMYPQPYLYQPPMYAYNPHFFYPPQKISFQ